MSKESLPQRIPLTGIYIDLTERSITFEADKQPVAKLTLAPEGIIFEATPITSSPEPPAAPVEQLPAPSAEKPASREKEPTMVLSGKLKTKPREGKPDRRGNATAWARFAAHVEGEEEAHLYSATFHRHTARIALGLERNDPLTIEGYAHPSNDPSGKRLDTFSVINLITYPGKPEKPS